MNTKQDILLITDNKEFSKEFQKKLILLRNRDGLSSITYSDAEKQIKNINAKVVLIHEHSLQSKTLNLIVNLKERNKNKTTGIILIADNEDRDFILSAYDEGISEHFYSNNKNFEILLRILNSVKNTIKESCAARDRNIMQKVGIIDEVTGLYSYKYAELIINEEMENSKTTGMFIALSPEENGKSTFSLYKMVNALKTSVRCDDIIVNANGMKFYVFLKNTDFHGAAIVLNKIKDLYESDFKIKAGICDARYKDFVTMEREALSALGESLLTQEEFVYHEDKDSKTNNWQGEMKQASDVKDLKIFKHSYLKKLEKVIVPVFFRMQTVYEEKLFKTKIEQYTDEKKSVFKLKSKNSTSTLQILYPGLAKVLIYITHDGENAPDNREITLPLNQVDQKILVSILEAFITEFKSRLQ